jgi:transcriptional regulator with XRE-family HTH domain
MNRGYRSVQLEWDGDQLRRWRMGKCLSLAAAAPRFGISLQHLSRIELGYVPHIELANRIVKVTGGAIRYRDIYTDFHPEYA